MDCAQSRTLRRWHFCARQRGYRHFLKTAQTTTRKRTVTRTQSLGTNTASIALAQERAIRMVYLSLAFLPYIPHEVSDV